MKDLSEPISFHIYPLSEVEIQNFKLTFNKKQLINRTT